MERLASALGVLAFGFAASTPAQADFAVVKFELGYCWIYWDPSMKPRGTGWSVVATAPTFGAACAAQDAAVKKGAAQVRRASNK
jgi:hypothetical protein